MYRGAYGSGAGVGRDVEVVVRAYARVRAACRPREVRAGPGAPSVSPHQAEILSHLDAVDPVMVTELAEYVGVTPSTMSLNLSRLERGGFVTRARDPDDRRVMNVRLTELGVRTRDALTALDVERVGRLLELLHPDRRRAAVQGLALLAAGADALVAERDHDVASRTGEVAR